MATAKKVTKTTPSRKAPAAKTVSAAKPIKTAFNRTTLNQHIAEQAGVEPKVVKAVLVALETTMLSSIHKKGLGEFTLPGLLKITALSVPAKKRRFGKDPFSGEERWFAPKPASIKIKTRALKKLKDAAL
jgi:nucleoid DNA-binding protein